MCPAPTRHGEGQQPGSTKAPCSGRVVPCGDVQPVPFHLSIQVAPPKQAVSPAQLAPSAPAGASALPRAPVQLAPNAPRTLQLVAPWPTPALRYFPGATGGSPGLRPALSAWRGLNTLSPRPRFFPTSSPARRRHTPCHTRLGSQRCHSVSNAQGHFCQPGAAWPAPCHRGEYQPSLGADTCLTCPPGSYCPRPGNRVPRLCPAHAYCPAGMPRSPRPPHSPRALLSSSIPLPPLIQTPWVPTAGGVLCLD